MFFTDDILAIKKIPVKHKIAYNPATSLLSVDVQFAEPVSLRIINVDYQYQHVHPFFSSVWVSP